LYGVKENTEAILGFDSINFFFGDRSVTVKGLLHVMADVFVSAL
jgi:hypothetical protein